MNSLILIIVLGKSFTCNLNCSFNKPTNFCPYSTPKLTINTFMEMMDTKSISSDNTISSQAISPTSTTQNPFHNITLNVTLNVAHAVSNVPLNLDTQMILSPMQTPILMNKIHLI
nr:795_t:CDS:1 [Entrophospora candida]CAG8603525.1 15650_t:CDS:1 [Entrophospora candida]